MRSTNHPKALFDPRLDPARNVPKECILRRPRHEIPGIPWSGPPCTATTAVAADDGFSHHTYANVSCIGVFTVTFQMLSDRALDRHPGSVARLSYALSPNVTRTGLSRIRDEKERVD